MTSSRRQFLVRGLTVAGGAAVSGGVLGRVAPAGAFGHPFSIVRSDRPQVTHGVQSGDVEAGAAMVWARADRPSRLVLEWSTRGSFEGARRVLGPVATPDTDLTAEVLLRALPAGQRISYRARFADLDDAGLMSEPVLGSFRTPPAGAAPIRFTWGGDTVGQGWGINPEFGGLRLYETMRATEPHFFVHSGDTIYADGPLQEQVALPDGSVWRNIVIPEKAKVAETLDEFRGNHRYNLMDENVRRFNAEVPVFAQWDDHEVTNNWYPGEVLEDPRYTERRVDVLLPRARRAFHEWFPIRQPAVEPGRIYRKISYGPLLELFIIDMRTYRGPNTANTQGTQGEETAILGATQLRWLQRQLAASRATWKVVCSDMPLGLVVPDGPNAFEAVAQGDGPPAGRELEIAELLSFLRRRRVRNVVWLTADVHYTAAHRYHPDRARFQDFDPFWEFVTGPLHAGTFGPNRLDDTFGPEVVFQKVADRPNLPPSAGLQFFGLVDIAPDTGVMTVSLRDLAGDVLHTTEIAPQ